VAVVTSWNALSRETRFWDGFFGAAVAAMAIPVLWRPWRFPPPRFGRTRWGKSGTGCQDTPPSSGVSLH